MDRRALDELAALHATDPRDVYERWAGGEFGRLEAATREDPDAVVAAALVGSAAGMRPAIERLVLLARAWPAETGRPFLAAIAGHGVDAAGAMVEEAVGLDDLAGLVPPRILVASLASPEAAESWADAVMDIVVGLWRWPELAALLDASSNEGLPAPWLAATLEALPWAAKNPVPDPDRPGEVPLPSLERDRALVPYASLFPSDDARVNRAETEASLVADTARDWRERGEDPGVWLALLGRSLPGCGDPMCCRPGLFEAALRAAGLNTRVRAAHP